MEGYVEIEIEIPCTILLNMSETAGCGCNNYHHSIFSLKLNISITIETTPSQVNTGRITIDKRKSADRNRPDLLGVFPQFRM